MCWFDFGKERFRNRVAINRITFESTEKKKFGWVVLDFEKILNFLTRRMLFSPSCAIFLKFGVYGWFKV